MHASHSKVIPMDSEVDIGYPPIDPGEGSAESH